MYSISNLSKAITSFTDIIKNIENNSKNDKSVKKDLISNKLKLIDCYMSLGEFTRAEEICTEMMNLYSNDENVLYCMANIYFESNMIDKAISLIEKIKIEDSPVEDQKQIEHNNYKLIEQLRKKIKEKQIMNQHYKDTYPSYNRFVSFFDWLKTNKTTYFPKLEMRFFSDDHRGVFTKRKIFVRIIIYS